MRMMAKVIPVAALLGAALTVPAPTSAITPIVLPGALAGTVRDVLGVPQMGAMVFLYDRREKLCERVMTDSLGSFVFSGLNPDLYSVRVTMASFLPALRNGIQILPGVQKNLEVSLSTLFSSIQLAPPQSGQGSLMTDDWKWVLRTSSSRRPILRILPTTGAQQVSAPVFSDTHALLRFSGGDPGSGSSGDLGTAFGVATSVFGTTQLQVVANVGVVSATGMPTAGFRTTFSRRIGDSTPSISVTMRQLSVAGRFNSALAGVPGLDSGTAYLRTMSVSMSNKTQLSDQLQIEYGMESDSVSYLSHNHYTSPYVKLTYIAPFAELDFSYTAGNGRPDLRNTPEPGSELGDLERDVAMLAMIPRVSLLDGTSKVQSGQNFEVSASRAIGSRQVRVTAYRESVKNAAMTVSLPSGGPGDPFAAEILPDLFSDTSVLNAGDYHTLGYTAAVTQNLGDNLQFTVSYGSTGVLVPRQDGPISDAAELREMIQATHRGALTTQASGTIRWTGTKFSGSYQFTDYRSATSGHLYATDPSHPEAGLNIYIRQPLPRALNRFGRAEATLDLKNMMAQGYLPMTLTDGRRMLLMRTPRTLRGGLSFTF
jgi:hypothetical protein